MNDSAAALEQLPLVTLYLSERCNSRCVTCDYWRYGRSDMTLVQVERLLPSLVRLRTQTVLLSGGEPLLNPEWPHIAAALRGAGMKLWLLSSGLSLAKHSRRAAALFETITVSLDGTDAQTYAAIRGLDAFGTVCDGIRRASAAGARVTVRVTLQRANYLQLPRFVSLAQELGAQQVSFLAVDVANPHAFARRDGFHNDLALQARDLDVLTDLLVSLEHEYAAEFRSGFIAESPRRMRHIRNYFAAVLGQGAFPPVRCNAPEWSAVIDAGGRVNPCFFISGPEGPLSDGELFERVNSPAQRAQRASIRAGEAPQCRACVCSIWHTPSASRVRATLPQETEHV